MRSSRWRPAAPGLFDNAPALSFGVTIPEELHGPMRDSSAGVFGPLGSSDEASSLITKESDAAASTEAVHHTHGHMAALRPRTLSMSETSTILQLNSPANGSPWASHHAFRSGPNSMQQSVEDSAAFVRPVYVVHSRRVTPRVFHGDADSEADHAATTIGGLSEPTDAEGDETFDFNKFALSKLSGAATGAIPVDSSDDDDGASHPRNRVVGAPLMRRRPVSLAPDDLATTASPAGTKMTFNRRRSIVGAADAAAASQQLEPSASPTTSYRRSRRPSVSRSRKLVAMPGMSLKEQFNAWSSDGQRKLTLADNIADILLELDGAPPTPEAQRGGDLAAFGGELSCRFAAADESFDTSRTKSVDLRPVESGLAFGSILDKRTSMAFKASTTLRRDANLGTKKQRRAAKQVIHAGRGPNSPAPSSSNGTSEDEMTDDVTPATSPKATSPKVGIQSPRGNKQRRNEGRKLTSVELKLLEAATIKLPVTSVIERLKQEVDEMDILQDCSVFVPFLALFIASFLLSVDITHTQFAVSGLTHVDLNGQFEYAAVQDASLRKHLFGGAAIDLSNESLAPDATSTSSPFSVSNLTNMDVESIRLLPWSHLPLEYLFNSLKLLKPWHTTGDSGESVRRPSLSISGMEPSFMEIGSATDFVRFFNDVFVPRNWACDEASMDYTPPQTRRLGSTLVLGAARLRVVRVRPDSCRLNSRTIETKNESDSHTNGDTVPTKSDVFYDASQYEARYQEFEQLGLEDQSRHPLRCYSPYNSDVMESRSFCGQRNPSTYNSTLFRFEECTAVYDEMERDRYPCSGYVVDLPLNASCRSIRELSRIIFPPPSQQVTDIRDALGEIVEADRRIGLRVADGSTCDSIVAHESTRFVALEYMVVAKSTNTFHRVSYLTEVTVGGSWTPLYVSRVFEVWTTSLILGTVFDSVLLLGAGFFFLKFFRDWKQFRWRTGRWIPFLFDLWNILEAANIVTFFVTLGMRWGWRILSWSVEINEIRQGTFPGELDTLATLYTSSRFANSINLVLSFLKLLKYLKMNERLGILTTTLSATQSNIFAILALFFFLTTGFAIAGVQLYGMFLDRFRNVNSAFSTLFFMLLGDIDYGAMRVVQPALTFTYFLSFVIIGQFLLLNFVIVILSEGFADSTQNMNVMPLSDSVLRALDVLKMVLRPAYVIEFVKRRLYERSRFSYMKQAADTLERHNKLVLQAFLQGSVAVTEPVMDFEDMEWWLPRDVFEGLGRLYLMTLWEDCIFVANWDAKSSTNHQRDILQQVIEKSIGRIVERSLVDIDVLDAHADRVDDAIATVLPVLPLLDEYLGEKKKIRAARERKEQERNAKLQKLQAATQRGTGTALQQLHAQLGNAGGRFGTLTIQAGASEEEAGETADFIVSSRRPPRGLAGPSESPDLEETPRMNFRSTGFGADSHSEASQKSDASEDRDADDGPVPTAGSGFTAFAGLEDDERDDNDGHVDEAAPAGILFRNTSAAFGGSGSD
jgi:hypothetical protein